MTTFDYDVFLSHNAADKPRVRRLAERLRDAGVKVWFDEWIIQPGDDIYLAIERGLERSRALVLCLSPAALASEWVGMERSSSLFRNPSNSDRRFIPLLLESCQPPATVQRFKYLDFRDESENTFFALLTVCRTTGKSRPSTKRNKSYDVPTNITTSNYKQPPIRSRRRSASTLTPSTIDVDTTLENTLFVKRQWTNDIAISPDGKWMASAHSQGNVELWDLERRNHWRTLDGHYEMVTSVEITPDGEKVLTGAWDQTIISWDTSNNFALSHREKRDLNAFSVVALPDSRRAIFAGASENDRYDLEIRNIITWKSPSTLAGHSGAINSVALSHDGSHAVSCSYDKTIRIWDLSSGYCQLTMRGHSKEVLSTAISPDDKFIISGSADKTIRIWESDTGDCINTLRGHKDEVNSVAISPDGILIASSGYADHTVRLWDTQTGQCLHIITIKDGDILGIPTRLTFMPDGTRLIIGTVEGSIHIFHLSVSRKPTTITPHQ